MVEPMLSPGNSELLEPLRTVLVKSAQRRTPEWLSHDDALKYFRGRRASKGWDPRVTEAFVVSISLSHAKKVVSKIDPFQFFKKYATRKTDQGTYALCCTREQEVVSAVYWVMFYYM